MRDATSHPKQHEATDVVVLDMSALSLTLDRERRSVTVSSGLEVVAVIPLDGLLEGLSEAHDAGEAEARRRELVFRSLDRTLETGRLSRTRSNGLVERLPVALYNPYTAEVATGPVPTTRAFSAGAPLPVPSGGLVCRLSADSLSWPDGTQLLEQDRSFAQMTRVFAAHDA